MDTSSLEMENIHESRESTPIDQKINNSSQINLQAVNSRIFADGPSGYKFQHYIISNSRSPTPEYIPADQQYGTTVFNIDGALTQSKQ
ncbi:hypothetical protein G6F46_009022 [Rhizopus delemar]|uniref:Uncharacterized protein n=2 Tax=Rhizopus TaxID=4842 RepID=A0A9P6Z4S0_9FUNG|nr:hypothetical protein G6F36_010812 [Rhizopus arrhizus]KAG1459039.1 hypothetical protein G6F55_004998 [Rhizopus delemar]KAG1485801.1 hypothetical protein G6F54_013322 [Rhizopus delemar]KAG1489648.1 hypothetical protein G6F53_013386 [Rhizopus delemar]KAG1494030.1 hypothetical protein G6F52_013185 [Rhizopus delemar]